MSEMPGGEWDMSSKIEQLIDEMEEYIEGCKLQPLSSTKIVVNRDEILELLTELRLRTPDETKKYQNILKNRDEILHKAKQDADLMLKKVTQQTNELINEHEIMQQAYLKANEIVQEATMQAQQILDDATNDANNIRISAIRYTDEMLANMQSIIANTVENARLKYEGFQKSLTSTYDLIQNNRNELMPQEETRMEEYGYE